MLRRAIGSWRLAVDRVPLAPDDLAARYDRAAAGWGRRLDWSGFSAAYRRLFSDLVASGSLADLPAGAWVLDAATGSGALALALASSVKEVALRSEPLLVTATDRSPAMVRAARAAFDDAGLDAAVCTADVRALPFADGSFDLAMAGHVLEHLPDPGAAVRELARVLRPGAPIVLLTTRPGPIGALVHLRWRVRRPSPDDLREWLRAAGVDSIEVRPLPGLPWTCRATLACIGRKVGTS
ncbi:MAG: methyltransferase domain-containing protein [Bacteroidota bacterium]